MWSLLTLLACRIEPPVAPRCDLSGAHLAIATSDFEVGALAAYVPDDGCLDPQLASIGGDAVVKVTGDALWVLQRTGGDALRRYAPGVYDHPLDEWVVQRGGNAHDIEQIGDRLIVSLYEEPEAVVLDAADGAEVGRIDLRDHADADGLPEADRMVRRGDEVWLALQRLDRSDGWAPAGPGRLVPLDPTRLTVGPAVEVDTNPKLGPHPDDDDQLVVVSGVFFVADGAAAPVALDGGGGVPWVTEAELGHDLTHLVGRGRHAVLLGVDFDLGGPARLDCVDLQTGVVQGGLDDGAWFVDAVADPDGVVWVASRTGLAGAGRAALYRVEPQDCTVDLVEEGFGLEPYALAWVGP